MRASGAVPVRRHGAAMTLKRRISRLPGAARKLSGKGKMLS
jgi:hypothetical protein